MFKLLLMCGGPSFERDISLNSVRSVYDNINRGGKVETGIIFVDKHRGKHLITSHFLYSNTTSDFDFKLEKEGLRLSEEEFVAELKTADLVFPILHGIYGEDGEIQGLLEQLGVAYVGSPASACAKMYNKETADYDVLKSNGFYTIPKLYVRKGDSDAGRKIKRFFDEYDLADVIIKPIEGGSSVGVIHAADVKKAKNVVHKHLAQFGELVVEPVCMGREFTVMTLQNHKGAPVALLPTEIEIIDAGGNNVFNKRRKYLATTETHYYCPARFGEKTIEKIRAGATELFRIVGAADFLRIDGWALDNGKIYFSDFNPISGMEQNSFIFQQGARIGLSHEQMIEYILNSAARRQWLEFPPKESQKSVKRQVNVLMGGWTSERQVSLMSGTNVWLKLLHSDDYSPVPYLLFQENGQPFVLEIPYAIALNHTTEEMIYQYNVIKNSGSEAEAYIAKIREDLGVSAENACSTQIGKLMTLDEFISLSKSQGAYVFIGLHGGFGEDGTLQAGLEAAGVEFNGSGSKCSALCMDKYKTGELVNGMNIEGLRACRKKLIRADEVAALNLPDIVRELKSDKIVVKPNDDGCSSGVVIIDSEQKLSEYIGLLAQGSKVIPENTFYRQAEKINLPPMDTLLLEEFIETDEIEIADKKLKYAHKTGWLELTVGVLESKGVYHALSPSITVASNGILSIEEKFQGGTGVNITPPPTEVISGRLTDKIRKYCELTAQKFGIGGYCRIDIFANNGTGEVIIIEINTLPGLSPSTVLFQQGAKESPALMPTELLEKIVSSVSVENRAIIGVG
ncbi:MAG: hypothetical protein LBL34_04230 [Clostridiales bacterium]|nr:hypothetical protein [Clostridiales bacterium]